MGSFTHSDSQLFEDSALLFSDLASLRSRSDFPYNAKLESFIVSRYDDIVTILDHPEVFSSQPTVPTPPAFVADQISSKCPMRGTLLGIDNPDHDRLRKSVNSFFVPRRLARFEPLIEKIAHQVVDTFVESGQSNIKSAFALPLPLQIISLVGGLDPERWQWLGRCLALFGGHAEFSTGTFEEKIADIVTLHEHIAELIQLRKSDRKDDLISHIWNERDSGVVEMTDFEHLSMIPGLLLAGHETTTNLLTTGLSHLLQNQLWEKANKDDTTRAATIEELVRYESAITGMKREVLREFSIRDTVLKPGQILFLAYNSGSRDSQVFEDANDIILNRKFPTQHLGFGRGIHACLGAPLARLLLRIEMCVLHERLPGLRLITPYQKRQYDHVHEGRGIAALEVAWEPPKASLIAPTSISPKIIEGKRKSTQLQVTIDKIHSVADDIVEITLSPSTGAQLPSWSPGAHIDIPVGAFGYRQYSLCGNPKDKTYKISVLREGVSSTGGSQYIHDTFAQGQELLIRGPRNHFPLRPASKYLFIAGGIGITAIKPMIESAREQGLSYQGVYLGSSYSKMAYAQEMAKDSSTTVWPKNEASSRFDISSLISKHNDGVMIYCCGPARLLEAVEQLCANYPTGMLNIERFENASANVDMSRNRAFDVLLKRSGRTIHVPAEKTLLEILNQQGVGVMSTCSKGTCGTCEVNVVDGVPEHRDTVLTALEKLDGKTMMPCVSRCAGSSLALDLW